MVWDQVRLPRLSPLLALLALLTLAANCNAAPTSGDYLHQEPLSFVSQKKCNEKTYTYEELAGYGSVAGNFRDKFGDTISVGSSIALEKGSWKQKARFTTKGMETYYNGILWMMPDRGWNTKGTTLWQPRIHKFKIEYTVLAENATTQSPPNIKFIYLDTIRFTDPSGQPITALDPTTIKSYDGYPPLPAAQYTGNGFGGAGKGGTRVSLDPEGLVLATNGGGFWVSDEYGPYIYRFNSKGKMELAVRPPEAYIPKRNGTQSFAANSPPIYNPSLIPNPKNPESGRSNNQGFEGLTVSPDGKTLYMLLQSALIQDGGGDRTTSRYARLLQYDTEKKYWEKEFVVPLPLFVDPTRKTNPQSAPQSEIHFLGENQFFILSRDSYGRGSGVSQSHYRQIDVFDLTSATDIRPQNLFTITTPSTPGTLISSITPAQYCPFLNINDNTQLARFGLRNGGVDDVHVLNEKWESLAVLPLDSGDDLEYLVLAVSDNDFITQDGYIAAGNLTYKDGSGLNMDSQALLFKVKLPGMAA